MTAVNDEFLTKWHKLVAARDLVALESILAADVTLGAPPYWDRLQGRPIVHHLLGLIIRTIEDFTYHREWHADSRGEREIALEFRGHVGELELQGIDLITLNEDGQVLALDVVIRPLSALTALKDIIAPQMMAFLRDAAAAPASS